METELKSTTNVEDKACCVKFRPNLFFLLPGAALEVNLKTEYNLEEAWYGIWYVDQLFSEVWSYAIFCQVCNFCRTARESISHITVRKHFPEQLGCIRTGVVRVMWRYHFKTPQYLSRQSVLFVGQCSCSHRWLGATLAGRRDCYYYRRWWLRSWCCRGRGLIIWTRSSRMFTNRMNVRCKFT